MTPRPGGDSATLIEQLLAYATTLNLTSPDSPNVGKALDESAKALRAAAARLAVLEQRLGEAQEKEGLGSASAPVAEVVDLPLRIVVGANGAYWRDFGDFYSMCPVSTDNDPVEPIAVYVRVDQAARDVLPGIFEQRTQPERTGSATPSPQDIAEYQRELESLAAARQSEDFDKLIASATTAEPSPSPGSLPRPASTVREEGEQGLGASKARRVEVDRP